MNPAPLMPSALIVVFDAQCLLCNGWVRFLLRHDRRGIFRFASIQGRTGQALLHQAGLQVEGLQTMLLVDGANSWQHTAAILRILHHLGWPWRAAWLGWWVPWPLRDGLYRLIARHRYWLFGRSKTCWVPPPDVAARFLD
jgi:predicted DCC family thiol-disulfide oxidoreductase YuxK